MTQCHHSLRQAWPMEPAQPGTNDCSLVSALTMSCRLVIQFELFKHWGNTLSADYIHTSVLVHRHCQSLISCSCQMYLDTTRTNVSACHDARYNEQLEVMSFQCEDWLCKFYKLHSLIWVHEIRLYSNQPGTMSESMTSGFIQNNQRPYTLPIYASKRTCTHYIRYTHSNACLVVRMYITYIHISTVYIHPSIHAHATHAHSLFLSHILIHRYTLAHVW